MGCNCGGGGSRSYLSMGSTGTSSAWAAAAANRAADSTVWIVTHPDGRIEEFATDSEAYRAIARTGGGIRSEVRPK